MVSTRDVTFKETLFYDPKEMDAAAQLHEEVEDIIEVYQLPSIQQRDDEDEFSDAHESNHQQERQTNDVEIIDRGTEPMLPTLCSTPLAESSSTSTVPNKAKPTSTIQPSREIIGNISQQNVQEQRRVRKLSEKARQQVYYTALNNLEDLQACYAAFESRIRHKPNRLHRDDLPEPPNT